MANDIAIYQGNDKTIEVTVKDVDGAAYDLAGATIYFNLKKYDSDVGYLINKSSGVVTEIKILTPTTDGKLEIYFVPADTSALDGKYVYDITLSVGVKKYTIEKGKFVVTNPVRD